MRRRAVLTHGALLGCGVALDRIAGHSWAGLTRWSPKRSIPQAQFALSLGVLQKGARQNSRTDEVLHLGGLNEILGFIWHDGDLILLGNRGGAPHHIDDVMAAARSAYRVGPLYYEPLGCSIDPIEGQKNKFAIQRVRVMGPGDIRSARLAVDCDYDLKLASSSLLPLADGLKGIVEREWERTPPCREHVTEPLSVSHRFWFAAAPPPPPRFTVDGASVWIDKPVQVQVLVERRVNSAAGAASADPNAEAFARDVTALLQSPHTRPDYQALRNFYLIVECFRLIKHQNIDAETLRYLLYEHRHESVEVRRYVVGVRRSEEIVCGGEIRERNGMIEAAEEGRLLE